MKKASLLFVGIITTLSALTSSAQGQHRGFQRGCGPEVSRSNLVQDDRSGLQALRTRGMGGAEQSAISRSLSTSLIGPASPMRAVAKSSQISATLNVYGTVIYSDSWTQSNARCIPVAGDGQCRHRDAIRVQQPAIQLL